MGIFDPKINPNVAYESPVQGQSARQNSSIAQLGNIGVGMLDSLIPTQRERESGGSKQSGPDPLLMGFQNGLLEVQALRRDGRSSEAQQLETTVVSNFLRAGGDLNPEAKQAFTSLTGKDPDEMALSQTQVTLNQVRESEEYRNAILAAPNDLGPEERDGWALNRLDRQATNAAMLEDNRIGWTEGKRDATLTAIKDVEDTIFGSVNALAAQGGSIVPSDVETIRAKWEAEKANIAALRPEGVSDEQWSVVQARLASVDKRFEIMSQLVTPDSLRADQASALIQSLPEEMNPTDRLLMTDLINEGLRSEAIALGALEPTKLKSLMSTLFTQSWSTNDIEEPSEANPTGAPTPVRERAQQNTAAQNLESVEGIVPMLNNVDRVKLRTDPQYAKSFVEGATSAFENMYSLAFDKGKFIGHKKIGEIFNGKIAESLQTLSTMEPVLAERLATQAERAITAQLDVTSQQMNNTIGESVFRVAGDQLAVDEDAVEEKYGPIVFQQLKDRADRLHGGDMTTLFRSGNIETIVGADSSRMTYETAQTQLQSIQALQTARNRFVGVRNGISDREELNPVYTAAKNVRGFNVIENDTEFLTAVNSMAERGGYAPEDLLSVISFETIGSFDPAISATTSSATGLIQFLKSTAEGLGTTTSDLAQMTRTEQLEYVEKYLEPFKGKLKNLGDLYMAVHWPAGVGKPSSYVMYEKGTPEYSANKGLDSNGDGTVTRGEAVARVVSHNKGGGYVKPNQIRPTPTGRGTHTEVLPEPLAETEAPAVLNTPEVPDSPTLSTTPNVPSEMDSQPTRRAFAEGTEGQPSEPTKDKSPGQEINRQATKRALDILHKMGLGEQMQQIPTFNSFRDALEAIDSGNLKVGDMYLLDDEIKIVGEG